MIGKLLLSRFSNLLAIGILNSISAGVTFINGLKNEEIF